MKKYKVSAEPKLHCNIDEKVFSKALLACRIFTAAALIYMALGSLLFWREFLVNTMALGIPFSIGTSFGSAILQLVVGLFLLLGWQTRVCAMCAVCISLLCAVIFFAGQYNHVFVAWCLLLCAPLSALMWLGAGIYSLDFKHSQQTANQIFRGKL